MHVRIGGPDDRNTEHINLALTTRVILHAGEGGEPGHITAYFAAPGAYAQGSLTADEVAKAKAFLESRRSIAAGG